jgi:site-specific DNA-methyltransferase (adenine-specific)
MDCLEGMKQYPDKHFDLAVVDPPYGIGANKMQLGNAKVKIYRGATDWDNSIPNSQYWKELFRVSKNQIVWGGNYMTEYLKATGAWLFWDKGTGENDFADGELAWTSYMGSLRKITKSWVGANAKDGIERIHPTQKPIYLYDWIFNKYLPEGGKVIDTHLGSGSNRIAAHKRGNIEFIGYELDKDYYEAQEKRYKQFISQLTIPFICKQRPVRS